MRPAGKARRAKIAGLFEQEQRSQPGCSDGRYTRTDISYSDTSEAPPQTVEKNRDSRTSSGCRTRLGSGPSLAGRVEVVH